MAVYTLDLARPPILCAGVAQTRTLVVYADAATSATSFDGSYSLYDPTGTIVSGAANVSVTAGVTSSFTPSAAIDPGSGYTEEWTATIGGVPRVWRVAAVVQTWTLGDSELLVSPALVLRRYAGMTEYPAGVTSWLDVCIDATAETLADYVRLVPLRGQQAADRGLLVLAAIDKAVERIARMMARNGNTAALAMAEAHAAAYIDRMQSLPVSVDSTGDGAPDAITRATDGPGFPPPAPLG